MDDKTIIDSGKTTIKHLLHENTNKEHLEQTREYLQKNLERIKSTSLKLRLLLFGLLFMIFVDISVVLLMICLWVFSIKGLLYGLSLIFVTIYFTQKYKQYKKNLKEQIYITYMYMLSNDIIDSNLSVKNPEDNIFVDRFKDSIEKNKLQYPIARK